MRSLIALVLLATSALAEAPEITVGANLALTGKLAFTGTAQMRGLELALEQINREGGINGRSVRLNVEDNAGDPKQAALTIRKQLSSSNAKIYYVGLTHIVQAIASPLAQAGALVLYGAAIPDPAMGNPTFFRDWGDAEAAGIVLADGLQAAGKKTTVYFGEENDSCNNLRGAFDQRAEQLGVKVLQHEVYNAGESDFRSSLLRLVSKKPEAILLCAFRDSGTILKQLNELGRPEIPVYHTLAPFIPFNDTQEMRQLFEKNGSVTSWFGFIPDDPTSLEEGFVTRYRERFNETPRVEAALSYDGMRAIAVAASKCPSENNWSRCVATALGSSVFSGVLGELSFDEHRKSVRKDFLMRVKDGRWERVIGN